MSLTKWHLTAKNPVSRFWNLVKMFLNNYNNNTDPLGAVFLQATVFVCSL